MEPVAARMMLAAAMLPAATTSMSESQSPTSWKCTSSSGTPWLCSMRNT